MGEEVDNISFMGRPAGYWMELDSFAKENMCDKLAETNVMLRQENARLRAELSEKSLYICRINEKHIEELLKKEKCE